MSFKSLQPHISEIKCLPDVLTFCAESYGQVPVFGSRKKDGLKELCCKALKINVFSIAAHLSKSGLCKKHFAIIGENSIEWIEAFFAASCCGGVCVPLDKELSAPELSKLIERSGCEVVFFSKSYKSKIDLILQECDKAVFVCLDDFEKIIEETDASSFEIQKTNENEPAVIVFTSGTTGESKGVVLSHKNILSDALSGCELIGECKKSVLILPLHHTFGLVTGVLGPMLLGGSMLISKSIRKFQRDIEFFGPDIILVVPVIAETIFKKIQSEIKSKNKEKAVAFAIGLSDFFAGFKIDLSRKLFADIHAKFGSNLKTIICGGAPISSEVIDGLCKLGIEVRNGYGITECSPIVSVNPHGKRKNKTVSVGKILSCCKVRVKNPDSNGIGEIEVCGSNVMLGYLGDEKATSEAFDEKWFKTGDLGYVDKDGYLYLCGRKKNLIILSNGKNVSPEELETKLLENPLIDEAVIFAKDGKICAEIYSSREDVGEKELYCAVDLFNRSVPPHKNIEKIIVRKTPFEKTTTMKIKRKSNGVTASV